MASLLREIIRKPSYARLFATSAHQSSSFLAPPPLLRLPLTSQSKFGHGGDLNPENAHQRSLPQVYPSFSFQCFLNPNLSPGLGGFEPVDVVERDGAETDDSGVMQADSVKKKRKKKMNKHKYKKLRKLLRRKT